MSCPPTRRISGSTPTLSFRRIGSDHTLAWAPRPAPTFAEGCTTTIARWAPRFRTWRSPSSAGATEPSCSAGTTRREWGCARTFFTARRQPTFADGCGGPSRMSGARRGTASCSSMRGTNGPRGPIWSRTPISVLAGWKRWLRPCGPDELADQPGRQRPGLLAGSCAPEQGSAQKSRQIPQIHLLDRRSDGEGVTPSRDGAANGDAALFHVTKRRCQSPRRGDRRWRCGRLGLREQGAREGSSRRRPSAKTGAALSAASHLRIP